MSVALSLAHHYAIKGMSLEFAGYGELWTPFMGHIPMPSFCWDMVQEIREDASAYRSGAIDATESLVSDCGLLAMSSASWLAGALGMFFVSKSVRAKVIAFYSWTIVVNGVNVWVAILHSF
jgi:hypothetical protein